MTQEQLKNIIESALIGKEYDPDYDAFEIAKIIKELCPQQASQIASYYKTNYCYVTYRGFRFIGWKEHKEKGAYLGHWRGYEWKVKSVEVFNWLESDNITDYRERFNKIDQTIETSDKIKQEKELEKIENFKKVRALFPNLDYYEFEQVLNGVISVSYEQIAKEKN